MNASVVVTKQEINQLLERLTQQFPMDSVDYIGCNRFVVGIKDWEKVAVKGVYTEKKVLLFNEKLEEIPLTKEYDAINMCTNGLIRVSKTISLSFPEEGRFKTQRKFGLINVDGKELLPCEYDVASPKLDGIIELTRDGLSFNISISELIEGEYNWEVYKESRGKSTN
jgi:hypothetical protein